MENAYHIFKEINLKSGALAIIREAEIEDAERIIRYLNILGGETDFLTFGKDEFYKSIEEEQEILKKFKESPNMLYLVVEVNNDIVGHMDLSSNPKKRMMHNGEFGNGILKAFWGEGLATVMMQEMLDFASANKVLRKINLMVSEKNVKAIRLYEKFGFEKEGKIREDIFVNGEYNDGFWMGRFLQ